MMRLRGVVQKRHFGPQVPNPRPQVLASPDGGWRRGDRRKSHLVVLPKAFVDPPPGWSRVGTPRGRALLRRGTVRRWAR